MCVSMQRVCVMSVFVSMQFIKTRFGPAVIFLHACANMFWRKVRKRHVGIKHHGVAQHGHSARFWFTNAKEESCCTQAALPRSVELGEEGPTVGEERPAVGKTRKTAGPTHPSTDSPRKTEQPNAVGRWLFGNL